MSVCQDGTYGKAKETGLSRKMETTITYKVDNTMVSQECYICMIGDWGMLRKLVIAHILVESPWSLIMFSVAWYNGICM